MSIRSALVKIALEATHFERTGLGREFLIDAIDQANAALQIGVNMDRELTNDETEALEKLIDKTDMGAVLRALAKICNDKAEHLATNWQDYETARYWDQLAGDLEKLSE